MRRDCQFLDLMWIYKKKTLRVMYDSGGSRCTFVFITGVCTREYVVVHDTMYTTLACGLGRLDTWASPTAYLFHSGINSDPLLAAVPGVGELRIKTNLVTPFVWWMCTRLLNIEIASKTQPKSNTRTAVCNKQ